MDQELFDQRYHEIDALIQAHRWREAHEQAFALVSTDTSFERAHAWFIFALTSELTGDTKMAVVARMHASACSDCTPELEADCDRDRLFAIVRRFEMPVDFLAQVDAIRKRHSGDENRLGCLDMLQARWHSLRGDYDLALSGHIKANRRMTDPVWLFNNRLPWIRAAVMNGMGAKTRSEIYDNLIAANPQRVILWIARLVRYGGKLGCRLDSMAQRLYWRVYLPWRARWKA